MNWETFSEIYLASSRRPRLNSKTSENEPLFFFKTFFFRKSFSELSLVLFCTAVEPLGVFEARGLEAGIFGAGELRHAVAVLVGGLALVLLVGRVAGGDEEHAVKMVGVGGGAGDLEVPAVDGVERSAKERDSHDSSGAAPASSRASWFAWASSASWASRASCLS